MPVYWVTFRLGDRASSEVSKDEVLGEFQAVLSELTDKVWAEPAAFIVFEAAPSIEVVASLLRDAIDPARDMFLLHEIDREDAIICGDYADPDILVFMPHLKKLL